MKVTIITLGSRGDVQPFIALARALEAAGHEATVATQAPFESLVTSQGVRYARLGDRPDAIEKFDEFSRLQYQAGRRAYKILKHANHWIIDLLDDQMAGGDAACRDADLLIEGTMGILTAHLAEYYDIPFVRAYLRPETRTSAYRRPDLVYPESHFAWRRRGSYSMVMMAVWSTTRSRVNEWRAEHGLDSWGLANPTQFHHYSHRFPVLLGYSEMVAPRESDYPDWHHITGFWTVDAASTYTPPADLTAFLESGAPPIAIGFGSIPVLDPGAMWDTVLDALDRTRQRAVVLTGWGGLDRRDRDDSPDLGDSSRTDSGRADSGRADSGRSLSGRTDSGRISRTDEDDRRRRINEENVVSFEAVPHDWLYPRSEAVIHHGGAGAAAAAFRAGVPMVIVPFLWDQAFWGERVHALGLGPAPIPQAELTADRLVDAVNAAGTANVRTRAQDLGRRLRDEDGLARAVNLLEATVEAGRGACLQKA